MADQKIPTTDILSPGTSLDGRESDTGWVRFSSDSSWCAVAPPFPLPMAAAHAGYRPDPLLEQVGAKNTAAIVLVRLGRYAVGIFEGRRLADSKTETRYVGSRHKAGGWSQKRFARIREKQVRELFDKVCEVAREKLEPREPEIERLWLGGDHHVIGAFLERCPWMSAFEDRTAARILATPVPDLKGLKSAIDDALRFLLVTAADGRP
jgi:peptide subunit release factor 1 (eRF1)